MPVVATVVKLGLTIAGDVASFDDTQKASLKETLKVELSCLEKDGCFLEVRVSAAGSINVEAILTVPDATGGNATAIQQSATTLAAQPAASLSSSLGVSVEVAPSVEVSAGVTVPLAVAPPPPSPAPTPPPSSPPTPPPTPPLAQPSSSSSSLSTASPSPPVLGSPSALAPAPLSQLSAAPAVAQSNGDGIGVVAGAAGAGGLAVVILVLLLCRMRKLRGSSAESTVAKMPTAPALPNSSAIIGSNEPGAARAADTEAAATAVQKHARSKSARNQVASCKAASTAPTVVTSEIATKSKSMDDVGAALAGIFSSHSSTSASSSDEMARDRKLDVNLVA